MRPVLISILLFIFADDINEIAAVNRLKNEAEKAYEEGNFDTAIQNYSYIYDSLNRKDDKVLLNLSNAYFQARDTANAQYHYTKLTEARDPNVRSIAYQQLGVMASNMGKYDIALEQFKNSLRSNPANNDARYNYELLKRLMQDNQQQQQDQNQDQQNKDQQNKDQQNEDQEQQQQDQEDQNQDQQENQEDQQQQNQEQKEQEEEQQQQQQPEASEEENEDKEVQSQPQDTEEMEISEEMARMILEAMRNNEIQYIQQQQKKARKPKDNGKPDW